MAPMSRWDALLALQDLDLRTDQLTHRRATLPARAEIDKVMASLASLESSVATAEAQRHDLGRSQQRLEDEIATLGDKAQQHDKALYSGAVTNPRELQAMQDEIGALKRRISQLEDQEIEIMEQIEPVDAELQAAAAQRTALDDEAARWRAELAEAEVAIDAELTEARTHRTAVVEQIEPELLATYEQLRHQTGGIAVARLVGGSCGGCHLGLSAVEIDRLKKLPPEEPAHCEECGRLLVR
jgi:predicted  nucleic acid-binding Zn-ribbon protein